jgi:hypothetical protein
MQRGHEDMSSRPRHSYDILGAGMLWKPKDLHKIRQNSLKFVKIHARRMLWQGAKWRILKNFILQNEECHH